MLDNFHVRGFRTFEDLDVPRIGRVNLIVGRNNVGKTMLLQALRVFQSQGSTDTLLELLRDREEFPRLAKSAKLDPLEHGPGFTVYGQPIDIAALFHGRAPQASPTSDIILESQGAEHSEVRIRIGDDSTSLITYVDNKPGSPLGLDKDYVFYPTRPSSRAPLSRTDRHTAPLLETGALSTHLLGAWWDKLALSDAETRVIDCLRIISAIERVALVERFPSSRVIMVKLEGHADPVPLKSLGDGVGRMFAMALALEIARTSKMLLIDEIENGIHYSILPAFWSFLFKAAAHSDVQIFATSHSWDCIEAFQQAASQDPGSGVLIKLAQRDGKITSTVFDDEELQIATRDGIELR